MKYFNVLSKLLTQGKTVSTVLSILCIRMRRMQYPTNVNVAFTIILNEQGAIYELLITHKIVEMIVLSDSEVEEITIVNRDFPYFFNFVN